MHHQDGSGDCTSYPAYGTSTHRTTNCNKRLEPKNDNNTVLFNKFNNNEEATLGPVSNGMGVVGFSADDIDQYDDEDQTSLKKNGSMQANWKTYQYAVNGNSEEEVINYYEPGDYYEGTSPLSYTKAT
jgi:hypothetical protein